MASRKARPVLVKVQPTIGDLFTLSLLPNTRISLLKEIISDRMGLSTQKISLLLHNRELHSGTLSENSVLDGAELVLVPAVEAGVTTVNSVDPVAMMKHSMSSISDQQIDDFLNGKCPLSVAIRVGESVVVVNLHRAKVDEYVAPPPVKRRCMRPRHVPEAMECSSSQGLRHLNTNPSSTSSLQPEPFLEESSEGSSGSSSSSSTASSSLSGVDLVREHHHSHHHCSSSSASMRSIHHRDPSSRHKELNGISMKRKAVMEAIGEILKKMYANSDKGRLPGSFKGRFSSEFTCDGDMKEILHSKTTMTSYGAELDYAEHSSHGASCGQTSNHKSVKVSKARSRENEQTKVKLTQLKLKMQQYREIRLAKRRSGTPCAWRESLNCEVPFQASSNHEPNGYCGMKRGFLLAD